MTRPEPVRADTFDLHAREIGLTSDVFQGKHRDFGFETIADDEEDIYEEDAEDDDDDDGDALSSSPSIPDEDIDFDFMYALHSFAATVEGQANATKGDTLVLLDDSNSYWWLVRVVKDNTVGYLPAETIETPQERLARLNKHRNIDLTAVMLEDHSPTTRSSSRKTFRRKGSKSVVFDNDCVYYQLEATSYESSDPEDEGDDPEDVITDGQLDDYDQEEIDAPHETTSQQRNKLEILDLDISTETEPDGSHPSPRIGIETVDVSDYGGRKIMHIKDLNDQVGERPTSAIFRDSKLEPLKISVTPSIARDGNLISPVDITLEKASNNKNKTVEKEKFDRKRSLSVSSSITSDSGGELDAREKELNKKGKKSSVFGNLFKKRSKKSSKEDEVTAEEGAADEKFAPVSNESGSNEESHQSLRPWVTSSTKSAEEGRSESSANGAVSNPSDSTGGMTQTSANEKHFIEDEPQPFSDSPKDMEPNRLTSPVVTNATSSLATPALPWSDAALQSFLDNDTGIRDALILVYEGSRLKKQSTPGVINPEIAGLYGACIVHIDEMSSHLDNVLMSYLFDVKK